MENNFSKNITTIWLYSAVSYLLVRSTTQKLDLKSCSLTMTPKTGSKIINYHPLMGVFYT